MSYLFKPEAAFIVWKLENLAQTVSFRDHRIAIHVATPKVNIYLAWLRQLIKVQFANFLIFSQRFRIEYWSLLNISLSFRKSYGTRPWWGNLCCGTVLILKEAQEVFLWSSSPNFISPNAPISARCHAHLFFDFYRPHYWIYRHFIIII